MRHYDIYLIIFLDLSQSLMSLEKAPRISLAKVSATVEALAFQDLDLDATEIAGEVTWEPAEVRSND